jgi:hypothetical protein
MTLGICRLHSELGHPRTASSPKARGSCLGAGGASAGGLTCLASWQGLLVGASDNFWKP